MLKCQHRLDFIQKVTLLGDVCDHQGASDWNYRCFINVWALNSCSVSLYLLHTVRVFAWLWCVCVSGEFEEESKQPSLSEQQKHQLKHRELFLSRQFESLPATHIRYESQLWHCCRHTLWTHTQMHSAQVSPDTLSFMWSDKYAPHIQLMVMFQETLLQQHLQT